MSLKKITFVANTEIMGKSKPYKKQEPAQQVISEPVVEYNSLAAVGETELLSDEIVVGAVNYARMARENGRMVPNNEVYGLLADRLGWK